ncbi:MAG: FtsX-like permease family protein [Betaproteobacteria bacterium]|nr:FtsX-like permease family protein [Betaproteobacteria bacterium]
MTTTSLLPVFLGQLLHRRGATLAGLAAIALGVALGVAVAAVNRAALAEFAHGLRTLSGTADLQVRGPRSGFDEQLYPRLARLPEVALASPALELEARLPGRTESLPLVGIDALRALRLQPALVGAGPAGEADGDAALRGESGPPAPGSPLGGQRSVGAPPSAAGPPQGGGSPPGGQRSVGAPPSAAGPPQGGGSPLGGQRSVGAPPLALLDPQAVFLSAAALRGLGLAVGDELAVQGGLELRRLRVAGLLPGVPAGQRLAVMDIAGAQETFARVGAITRIDLRLRPGTDPDAARRAVAALLPPGVQVTDPHEEEGRTAALSRAYRVNLTMLALIALVTGAFLVFSTQALAVVQRRSQFALLRALGLTRRQLAAALAAEGAAVGVVGAAVGVALGHAVAEGALRLLGGDLGAGYFRGLRPQLVFDPLAAAQFFLLGVAAATAGAWLPALEAARVPPAAALKAGDEARALERADRPWHALACLAGGAAATLAPPVAGLPVFGYLAIALLLVGAVLLMPALTRAVLARLPTPRATAPALALAQLRHAPGQAAMATAGVLAAVALAAAMAVMVASFRDSVDAWLQHMLPAQIYVRASPAGETGFLDEQAQRAIRTTPGVADVYFIRHQTLRPDPHGPPLGVVARPIPADDPGRALPLREGGAATPGAGDAADLPPAWISEALADLRGLGTGDILELPLAGRLQRLRVAGIWRDYARQYGAVALDLDTYRRLSADPLANDAGLQLAPGATPEAVAAALRQRLGSGVDIVSPEAIRRLSLDIFDRSFAVTYVLEALAVVIGLFGVAAAFGALAAARRREFGMLRQIGMTRRQVAAMIACEGALAAALGVGAGMATGAAVALVLVEVVNRQSFHWSMELVWPVAPLAGFGAVLVGLSAATAVLAARRAMRVEAVRAVREDW